MWCSFYIGVIINPECGRASEKHAVLGEEDRMQSDQEAKRKRLDHRVDGVVLAAHSTVNQSRRCILILTTTLGQVTTSSHGTSLLLYRLCRI